MTPNTEPLIPDATYHIFNRINGDGVLYKTEENYKYFLELYKRYIVPVAETFCYCLMPNHFHFLIKVRSAVELNQYMTSADFRNQSKVEDSSFVSQQFSNMFNSYSQAYNKQQNRKGSLFIRPFKRKQVIDEAYLRKLVHYIHFNPKEAGLCGDLKDYKYSSYRAILQGYSENLNTDEVIVWFCDLENFKFVHRSPPEIFEID